MKIPKYMTDEMLEHMLQVFAANMQKGQRQIQAKNKNVGASISQRDMDNLVTNSTDLVAATCFQIREETQMIPFNQMEHDDVCREIAAALCKGFNAGFNNGVQHGAALQRQAQAAKEAQEDRRIIVPH